MDEMNLNAMFAKIISCQNCYFKSQQRGEADLTDADKIDILQTLLNEKPSVFLQRYHKYLDSTDVLYFELILQCSSSRLDVSDREKDDIEFYMQLLRASSATVVSNYDNTSDKKVNIRTKNRRFQAMRKLITDGEYFSDWEMQRREPLLYDRMVGKYQTAEEKYQVMHSGCEHNKSDMRLSNMLIDFYDRIELDKKKAQQLQEEDNDEALHSESSEEENDDACSDFDNSNKAKEKQQMREEFIEIMQQKFLSGNDSAFDYAAVDNSEEYDDQVIIEHDAEDVYFDTEQETYATHLN